tara:strand:- start:604 stop:1524 length:921 start_codon:yes stop_codon:yes gene_type:complete
MIYRPENQLILFGLKKFLNELIYLYEQKKLPNKILLSGQKGLGKCTMAYHLINYALSEGEEFSYNTNQNEINPLNRSYKLIQNNSNTNFDLIDVSSDKRNIDIDQIRKLIQKLKTSSFNNKPRFILIDNIDYLNKNAINALLKILEEPSKNVFFILINNNKKVLATLKSRCLDFKIFLDNKESQSICKKILGKDFSDQINNELLDYYSTPGKILNLIEFSEINSIDLKDMKLGDFLTLVIDKSYYKKDSQIKFFIYDFFELFLTRKFSSKHLDFREYFLKQMNNIKKFNLDEESLFIEFRNKLLNG